MSSGLQLGELLVQALVALFDFGGVEAAAVGQDAHYLIVWLLTLPFFIFPNSATINTFFCRQINKPQNNNQHHNANDDFLGHFIPLPTKDGGLNGEQARSQGILKLDPKRLPYAFANSSFADCSSVSSLIFRSQTSRVLEIVQAVASPHFPLRDASQFALQ